MAANGYHSQNTADLASVLRTLASLTQHNQPHQETQVSTIQDIPSQEWINPIHFIPTNSHHNSAPTLESFLPTTDQINSANLSRPVATKNVVDPTCILDWGAGLKYVMKKIARNESIIDEIRRMRKLQNEHEEQWWNARNALISKARSWEEGQKKLDDVLKAVGGVSSTPQSYTKKSIEKELQTFDLKVHKAQMQMVREMSTKLRSIGIPFFGTKSELVRSSTQKIENAKNGTVMINNIDLINLQRRMLTLLEDLCDD